MIEIEGETPALTTTFGSSNNTKMYHRRQLDELPTSHWSAYSSQKTVLPWLRN